MPEQIVALLYERVWISSGWIERLPRLEPVWQGSLALFSALMQGWLVQRLGQHTALARYLSPRVTSFIPHLPPVPSPGLVPAHLVAAKVPR